MTSADDVLSFWLDEVGPEDWYKGGEALDDQIRGRFQDTWAHLADGGLSLWLTYPSGTLAYILVADQFSRNMFRGTAEAFASDAAAGSAAKQAIARGWDMRIDEPARQFFYMPLMHAECLSDQDRCVRLLKTRMPETGHMNLLHARAHRDVIRKFGRFPYRNEALGRKNKAEETAYLADGGYGSTVRAMEAEMA
jgi:uncharacterized protein (DUF924 family)